MNPRLSAIGALGAVLLINAGACAALAQEVAYPRPRGLVNDYAGVLSQRHEHRKELGEVKGRVAGRYPGY